MAIKTLKVFDFKDKKVLLRVDINSPVVNSKILDNPRLKEAAETIKFLSKQGAKIAILAHQGRPGDSDFLPLAPHSQILSDYSGIKIRYAPDLFGETAKSAILSLKSGQAVLLENVRSYDEELNISDPGNRYFALCKLFDVYVNDAFSVCHRAHGSIIIPPRHLPSCIGISFEKELAALNKFQAKKHAKNVFLLGGAKIRDYFPLFKVLRDKNNIMLVSGVLANLFLVSQGGNLGYENSWLEQKGYSELIPQIREVYTKYESQIVLPVDFAVGNLQGDSRRKEIDALDFPTDDKIWDVGHQTVEVFKLALKDAKVIFMKGPLGFSEIPEYSYSTVEILKAISKSRAFTLLGGGHLTETLEKYKIPDHFSHISTSGGALIAFISGEELPGLEALQKDHL